MSCNYAEGLSPYANKGKLGLPENFDSDEEVLKKVEQLKEMVLDSKHTVIYTGAGVSTSAGIPDFRGPKGVWTLEKKGLKPDMNISWDDAKPTKTHMAISKLTKEKMCQFVMSQNIDGLHLRSGVDRDCLAELHGNMFVDECAVCKRMFVRSGASSTVGRKMSNESCKAQNVKRPCRGKLRDFVLDWEDELPDDDCDLSHAHSMFSELSIVIGSTLQIIPAGNMPTYTKKTGKGKLVIINLQATKHDKKADLIIRNYADKIFQALFEKLGMKIPEYDRVVDPVMKVRSGSPSVIEYTQNAALAKKWMKKCREFEAELKEQRKVLKNLKKQNGPGKGFVFEEISESEDIKEEDGLKEEKLKIEVKNGALKEEKVKIEVKNGALKEEKDGPPLKMSKTEEV